MNYLIGNSGLVGKNLLKHQQFDATFNSSSINNLPSVFVEGGDVILSCLPATKWQINQNKLKDLQNIHSIINTLTHCAFNNIVLISTIDVYLDSPLGVDESHDPTINTLHYGSHRLLFEKMVRDLLNYKSLHVFRLPALFGDHLKKNVLFDLLYNNNVDKINLNTYYQWYDLGRLHDDIKHFTTNHSSGIFNLFTQPVYTADVVDAFFPAADVGYEGNLVQYDWKTQHFASGYILDASQVMQDIEKFIYEARNKQSSL